MDRLRGNLLQSNGDQPLCASGRCDELPAILDSNDEVCRNGTKVPDVCRTTHAEELPSLRDERCWGWFSLRYRLRNQERRPVSGLSQTVSRVIAIQAELARIPNRERFVPALSQFGFEKCRELHMREPDRDCGYKTGHGCPVKSRRESVGWKELVTHPGNRISEVPVKWGFSRKG